MDSCLALRCLRRKLGIDALDVKGPMDREALKDKRATGKKETHTGSHKSSHSSWRARSVSETILDHPGVPPADCRHASESSSALKEQAQDTQLSKFSGGPVVRT